MKRRNKQLSLAITAVMLAALACNLPQPTPPNNAPDPNAAFTAAAQTVAAQLTQSAQNNQPQATATQQNAAPPPPPATNTNVPPPTLAPISTNTNQPTATQECDKAQFITDVNIPDGTEMTPGFAFTKTWRIKNVGTCTWSGYSVVFDAGNSMGGAAATAIGSTPPGGTVDISVPMTAPPAAGNYRGYWRIRNASGVLLPVIGGYQNKSFYVDIKVLSGGGGAFAVTSVTYTLSTWSDAGHTGCPRVIAHITVNQAGTVTYKWTSQDTPGGWGTTTITFAAAGTKNVRFDWERGSVWAGTPTWVGIFIVSPNNQNFGHINFNDACTAP